MSDTTRHRLSLACLLVGPFLCLLAWSHYWSAAFYYLSGFCVAYGASLQKPR